MATATTSATAAASTGASNHTAAMSATAPSGGIPPGSLRSVPASSASLGLQDNNGPRMHSSGYNSHPGPHQQQHHLYQQQQQQQHQRQHPEDDPRMQRTQQASLSLPRHEYDYPPYAYDQPYSPQHQRQPKQAENHMYNADSNNSINYHSNMYGDSSPTGRQDREENNMSHHPNAINRYPFSIPSISAKLDQPHHGDGNDALSNLWKKTTPIQEPYFQTRHTIASQHTLSTLGGVLFSLDEIPTEFNQDMYIAMRNRIFELEAKSVNYSPFSHSRKRPFERSDIDDYSGLYGYGYDMDYLHYSKRPAYRYPPHGPPDYGPPHPLPSYRHSSSFPSWYTPEAYSGVSHYPPYPRQPPSDQDRDFRDYGGPYYEDNRPESRPGSRSGSPKSHHNNPSGVRSAYSPPPAASEQSRQQPHSSHPSHPSHPHPSGPSQDQHPQQQHPQQHPNGERPYPPGNHSHHPPGYQPPSHSSQPPQHSQQQGPSQSTPQQLSQGHPQPQSQQHLQPVQPNGPTNMSHIHPANSAASEQRQSIHQQRHRAQQQAQSAHSRSYHLHKHMRLLDQQRAAQIAVQQQQQLHPSHSSQQQQSQKSQQQQQGFKPIQRQYQPHQQMYPGYNQPVAIKPHPGPTQAQLQQQQLQQQKQQTLAQTQTQAHQLNIRPHSFQQQRLTPQQQLMQRYQQQRQIQQKQQQLRQLQQLQYLRNRAANNPPAQKATVASASNTHTGNSSGSHSPTPPRVFGPQVDRPIKKSTRPLECSNCMALDSLAWKPKVEVQVVIPDGSGAPGATSSTSGETEGSKILCPACTLYLQTHGKPRPVPPFRTNFLKKIHTRFKRELQEVRFQGWQDAQVLEIEDRMVEREFQMVFNGLDENDAAQVQSRSNSVAGSPAPAASVPARTSASRESPVNKSSTSNGPTEKTASESSPKETDAIVIKIEDDDDETIGSLSKSKLESVEVRTFQSEASVGELFGHRWRTEPVVGYTLVHFGGSDRTRMVPMNPTVPFLTVKFDRAAESITFAFRVLVNGLCLLSSGGGPPALHMPEMADDEESEEEEEVVVVPDNDKEDETPPPST
ncbi:hypothetical protein FBU30_011112 [Linnemannia zychae]|nr:hypothetical protein FBU30_011112 [Linnemannia zychae]